jgi:hypothetical protein
MRCKRCNRLLKDSNSVKLGFGIVCYKKFHIVKKVVSLEDFDLWESKD